MGKCSIPFDNFVSMFDKVHVELDMMDLIVVLLNPFCLNFSLIVAFQISGGWRHTMALTSDGKLYGWGWNKVSNLFP
jgi:alpha-tubulin suppressor-like RCC1 family protein